jgi:hypothetical protein
MTPAERFQAEVARLALAVAGEHGFALAGGNALIAHGIIDRPTNDIDLFTPEAGGVAAAADAVAAALTDAGMTVEKIAEDTATADLFYGFEQDMAEFAVRRDDQSVRVQLVRFDRARRPIVMEIGPVLHLDDAISTKVAAMATRAYPRDFIDVAAALSRYTAAELVELGRTADPALTDEEFAEAMQRFDRLHDYVFTDQYGLTQQQVVDLRRRLADWPRTPGR